MSLWLILSAGLVVFALAHVTFYEFVRPKLAKLKWDMPNDEDDDFRFDATILSIILMIVIVGLGILVFIIIGR